MDMKYRELVSREVALLDKMKLGRHESKTVKELESSESLSNSMNEKKSVTAPDVPREETSVSSLTQPPGTFSWQRKVLFGFIFLFILHIAVSHFTFRALSFTFPMQTSTALTVNQSTVLTEIFFDAKPLQESTVPEPSGLSPQESIHLQEVQQEADDGGWFF
jgi:hypothetical protein